MGKEFQENPRGNFAGRGAPRGGRGGGRGGFGGGFNRDQGPPSYVVPYGIFLHKSQNQFVVKCTDMARFPKFNRNVYLETKAKVGSVDQILGPLNAFYFSVKPAEGVNPSTFKAGQVFYMNPEDLLSTDKFTKPQAPRPKRVGGPGASGPGQGGKPGFGGRPQFGGNNRGGFGGGNRGGSRGGFGGNRGGFNTRGR